MNHFSLSIVIAIPLLLPSSAHSQEASPTPPSSQEFSFIRQWPGYETPEGTIKEFQKKANELLDDDGRPRPNVGEEDLKTYLGLISAVLGEHLQLRYLETGAAMKKFGAPLAIHKVRYDNIFRIAIPYMLDWTEETGGTTVWHPTNASLPMECQEYSDLYIWTGGGAIWAISPRSPRFDKYVKGILQ